MAFIRKRRSWDSQPQEPAQINADSWQSQGLLQWHPFNGNALEPVSGAVSSLESGAAFAVGQRGFHAAFDGTNDYIQTSRPIVIGNAFTFSFWFYRTTNNTRQTVFGCENAAGVIQIEVGGRAQSGIGQGAVCAIYSGAGVLDSADDVWATNVWNHVVVTGTAGGVGKRKIYVNGGEVGLAYDGGQGFTETSIARTFGRRSSGSQQFAGQLQDCRIYDYGMSAEQALRLYRDGLELFAPRTIWIRVSAGGGTTINGALGTATASGFPATVNANRAVAASLGTVAASGFQASVTQNATIEGNLGVAAASGFLATVNASTIIAASPGVVAASGFQATVANSFDTTVNGSLGTAVASGFTAGISANTTIAGSLGVAAALGFQATVDNSSNTVIDGALGVVVASGFTAGINASTIIAASSGVVEALGFQASITANGAVTISVVQPYITVYFWKRVS